MKLNPAAVILVSIAMLSVAGIGAAMAWALGTWYSERETTYRFAECVRDPVCMDYLGRSARR